MTAPADPSALVAHLDALAATYSERSTAMPFERALIDAYPALAAAIRDLTAQVAAEQKGCEQAMADAANWEADNKKLEAACTALAAQVEGLQRRADSYEHGMNENGALVTRTRAERDALAARLDVAEQRVDWLLIRGARLAAILSLCAPCGLRPDIGRLHDEQKAALDAWRALSPSGGGHDTDTDTGGGG